MNRRAIRRAVYPIMIALGVTLACRPIPQQPPSPGPTNACPEHPCAAYTPDGGSVCNQGVCLETVSARPSRLVLLVAVPIDARLAPGLTFAVDLPVGNTDSGVPPPVVLQPTLNLGRYVVSPDVTSKLDADVGNNMGNFTSLPAHATYRPLWSPQSPTSAISLDAGRPFDDAVSVGLPLYPVQVGPIQPLTTEAPGPAQGPDMVFSTFVQGEVTYERTITPDPPFDGLFPPDVKPVVFQAGFFREAAVLSAVKPDTTMRLMSGSIIPAFDLSRADGKALDGWTAYLRDQTTKRPLSPVKTLRGMQTADGGLQLPTSHHPAGDPPDALTHAELVIAPSVGEIKPTAIFPAIFSRTETYPLVPGKVPVQGSIAWSDENPVSADIVFQATGIYAALTSTTNQGDGGASMAGGGATGDGSAPSQFVLYSDNYEYVVHAPSQPDLQSHSSTYSIDLPRGEYRMIVRPLEGVPSNSDAAPASHALTVVEHFIAPLGPDSIVGPNVTVDRAPVLVGRAVVADQRPLSGATVEALPTQCARFGGDAGMTPSNVPDCMPRYAQTTTDSTGAFKMELDPGTYIVRVEPVDGTRLPWVWQTVQVPSASPTAFVIPAPVYRELQVLDQDEAPVTNAVVRMFTMPAAGPAVEVGRAVTDGNGQFAMYLDPAVQ
jgi:hypothetical protein